MLFIKEYKEYQIYKIEDIDIAGSDNSKLLNNKTIVFKREEAIELGKEIIISGSEKEAINDIDLLEINNKNIETMFKEATEKSKFIGLRKKEKIREKEKRKQENIKAKNQKDNLERM